MLQVQVFFSFFATCFVSICNQMLPQALRTALHVRLEVLIMCQDRQPVSLVRKGNFLVKMLLNVLRVQMDTYHLTKDFV